MDGEVRAGCRKIIWTHRWQNNYPVCIEQGLRVNLERISSVPPGTELSVSVCNLSGLCLQAWSAWQGGNLPNLEERSKAIHIGAQIHHLSTHKPWREKTETEPWPDRQQWKQSSVPYLGRRRNVLMSSQVKTWVPVPWSSFNVNYRCKAEGASVIRVTVPMSQEVALIQWHLDFCALSQASTSKGDQNCNTKGTWKNRAGATKRTEGLEPSCLDGSRWFSPKSMGKMQIWAQYKVKLFLGASYHGWTMGSLSRNIRWLLKMTKLKPGGPLSCHCHMRRCPRSGTFLAP